MSSLLGKRNRRDDPEPVALRRSKRSQPSHTSMPQPPRTPSSASARVPFPAARAAASSGRAPPQLLAADRRPGRPSRRPPRASFPPSQDTPCKRNSESVRDHAHNVDGARADPSLTCRSEMDLLLYDELYANVACDVADMWLTFPTTKSSRAMIDYAIADGLYRGSRWTEWPANPTEASVLRFFLDLLAALRAHCWPAGCETFDCVPSGWIVLEDGDCERKTDVVVVGPRDHHHPERRVSWLNVRVVGELKSSASKSNLDDTLLQVANYAREVFGAQPARRWVPAFTLCGSELRVWRFDRAGACGSTLIDIHQHPEQFLAAITAYATMSATDVGYDPSIFFSTDAGEVVFDPTVHWRGEPTGTADRADAYPYIYVPVDTLDAPASADRADAYPYIYVPVDTLDAPASAASAPPQALWSAACTSWTALSVHPTPISRRIAIATRGSACWKARRRDGAAGSPWQYVVKDQWRSYERDPEGVFLRVAEDGVPGVARYIWHSDVFVPCDGQLRLDDITALRPASACASTAAAPTAYPALTKTSTNLIHAGSTFCNRVHTRLLSGPVGRPLLHFGTYTNLLLSFKQAIEAHRHMYTQHRVLHRDVSNNNILLNPSGPGGFLIDFDLAIFTDRTRVTGASHRTGTFDFMALDVLLPPPNHQHTPLHDLESFFYVLLWVCIYYGKDGVRRDPPPNDTMFTPQATTDVTPWQTASGLKSMYMKGKQFHSFVLPTLFPEAHECLASTLAAWREVAMEDDQAMEEIGEEVIALRYQQVLDILEAGIAECAGR